MAPHRISLDKVPISWMTQGTGRLILKRLVIEFYSIGPSIPDVRSFQILYLDGRPASIKNAELGVRHMAGLNWLTNDIVYEGNVYNVTCSFYDYYDAESGEHLPDISWFDCGHWYEISNQYSSLSPNERWLVVDRTDHDIVGIGKTVEDNNCSILFTISNRASHIRSRSHPIYISTSSAGLQIVVRFTSIAALFPIR